MNLTPCPRRFIPAAAPAILVLLALVGIAHAELVVVENADDQQGLTVFKMTVTPAAEPVPALKHRLTLRERDLKPGNAATHYLRAFPEGGVDANWKALQKDYGLEEVHDWYNVATPIGKVPMDKARIAAARFQSLIDNFVARGAERLECDWGHGIITEMSGPDIYAFLLPEIQAMRSVSRALMLCTRVAVADGDYERALDILRMNYRLGQDTAKSPFLVSGLVGIAICGLGNSQVIELIAAPDSPNLYWAIAELPRPLVDLRAAIRHEFSFNTTVFPFMHLAESTNHSPEEWARLLAEAAQSTQSLTSSSLPLDDMQTRLAVTGLSLVGYGAAKQRLIASGMHAETVERMPVGQVIAVDSSREYRRIADSLEKWWYVPFGQRASDEQTRKELQSGDSFDGNFGSTLARLLLPAINASYYAQVRLQWQLDALRTIEAIRMHAAATGRLPASLDEVTVVPVPVNPVTQQPYQYRLDGDTAVLELPFTDDVPAAAWRFEIKLATK